MARRTMTLTHLWVHPYGKRSEWIALDGAPGGDMLKQVDDWLQSLGGRLRDEDARKYVEIDDRKKERRTLLIKVSVGSYDDPGSVRNVQTGTPTHQIKGDEAATIPLRCLLIVPAGATSALMCVEHGQNRNAGSALVAELTRKWSDRNPRTVLNREAVMMREDWLEQANLLKVTAYSYGHQSDAADAGLPEKIGVLKQMLVPALGDKYLSPRILPALRNKRLNQAKVLGLRPGEVDRVDVTLAANGRERTMVLDEDAKTPMLRELLSDHGQSSPNDAEFVRRAIDAATPVFHNLDVGWSA